MNEVLEKDVELAKEQKAKAVEYLRTLDIFKPYIDGFVKEDKVCYFENFGGYWVYQEEEVEKKMREIEAEHNCKVYATRKRFDEFVRKVKVYEKEKGISL